MKHYVYVLESLKDQTRYVGLSEDPKKRLKAHNEGQSKYTKGHKPYRLIYQELCHDRTEARRKEKFYKSGSGREVLEHLFPCSSVR